MDQVMVTFFTSGDFSLTATVHAMKTFAAHSISTATETGALLGAADSVVKVAEAALTATAVLRTFILTIDNHLVINPLAVVVATEKSPARDDAASASMR